MPSKFNTSPVDSGLGVTLDSTLLITVIYLHRISYASESCFLSTRDLRRIRNNLSYSDDLCIAVLPVSFSLKT